MKKSIFGNKDIEIKKKDVLHKGFFLMQKWTFLHRLFRGGWSHTVERELLVRGKAVGVLLYDPLLDNFVLIEQVRVGAMDSHGSAWLLEVVAGMVEEGESIEQVAVREVREEAGCEVSTLYKMPGYWVSPGASTEYVDLFLGLVDSTKVAKFAGLDTEHEDIKVHVLPRQKILQYLEQGGINNAMTIICLQWFLLNEKKYNSLTAS